MAYSGTAASRASIDVLKPIFDKDAREVIQTEYNFYKYVKQADGEKLKLNGDYFEFEIQATRNDRSENTQELGDLPTSAMPVFKRGSIRPTRVFAPLQIGHEMQMLADSDAATYITRLELLYTDARNALFMNLNRQAVGDGTGIVATLQADDDGGGASTYTYTVDDTKYFEEGALYSAYVGSATTNHTPSNTLPAFFRVTAIPSATTVTMEMTSGNRPDIAANAVFIRSNSTYSDGSARVSLEQNGLQSITADADFLGIAKTNRRWNAIRYDASAAGGTISPRLLARVEIAKRRASATGGKFTSLWMSPEQAIDITYGPTGTYENIRYSRDDAAKASVKNQNKPSINFDGRDIQVQTDLMLPVTKAFALVDESLFVGQLHDVKFEEFDGNTSLPVYNPTTGAYVPADIMWLAVRQNMGCFARNEFAEIYNLSVPAA
jgi:hypothetical protein